MSKCRFIILFLFTFVSVLKAEAQESMHFFFRHITEYDGLLHNEVYSITQDGKGFIWMMSFDGLQIEASFGTYHSKDFCKCLSFVYDFRTKILRNNSTINFF